MILEVTEEAGVTWLTLNDEKRRNALSSDLVEALHEALHVGWGNGSRLIAFRGNGPAFCAGLDLSGVSSESHGDLLLRLVRIEQLLQAVHCSPVPTAAMAHGACFGAGADLFCACTYRIAAPDARFMFPGPQFGLVLGTRRLSKLINPDMAWEILSGRQRLTAEKAREIGLATEVRSSDEWGEAVQRLMEQPGMRDLETTGRILSAMRQDDQDADLAALVRSICRTDFRENLISFAEKRG